jgi:hypothetical protein
MSRAWFKRATRLASRSKQASTTLAFDLGGYLAELNRCWATASQIAIYRRAHLAARPKEPGRSPVR